MPLVPTVDLASRLRLLSNSPETRSTLSANGRVSLWR